MSVWISVKDRLPKEGVNVIVFASEKVGSNGVIAITYYTHHNRT